MVSAWSSAWLAAALLCAPAAMANVNTGNMPDLGYPEPNWYPIRQGTARDPAVVYNETTTVWGNIEPYSTANASLCKWVNTAENGGRGVCQTDISWIHAAVGLAKSVFSDQVVNYILRFHLEGACYRSTQVRHPGVQTLQTYLSDERCFSVLYVAPLRGRASVCFVPAFTGALRRNLPV